jgi:hypothetical protein
MRLYLTKIINTFNQRFLESKLPMLKPIYAYMKSIGITSALSSGNENEYFTSLGIPLPTPAQFYPITEALAAFVASQRGDHAYGTTPMPGGTRRAQAQGKSQLNEVADGALYQTPITWTKKSNWLSYSRIINWG